MTEKALSRVLCTVAAAALVACGVCAWLAARGDWIGGPSYAIDKSPERMWRLEKKIEQYTRYTIENAYSPEQLFEQTGEPALQMFGSIEIRKGFDGFLWLSRARNVPAVTPGGVWLFAHVDAKEDALKSVYDYYCEGLVTDEVIVWDPSSGGLIATYKPREGLQWCPGSAGLIAEAEYLARDGIERANARASQAARMRAHEVHYGGAKGR